MMKAFQGFGIVCALVGITAGSVQAQEAPRADRPIMLGDGAMIESHSDTASLTTLAARIVPSDDKLAASVRLPTVIHTGEGAWRLYGHGDAGVVYAESTDGVMWNKVDGGTLRVPQEARNGFTPFVDDREGVPAPEKFKALGGGPKVLALVSEDGKSWRKVADGPAAAAVDETGLRGRVSAVWSQAGEHYVAMWSEQRDERRVLVRATSKDFRSWSQPEVLELNAEGEDLWSATLFAPATNPPLLMAFLTRTAAGREQGADVCLATSRDGGITFERPELEAWLRPQSASDSWAMVSPSAPVDVAEARFRVPEQSFYSGGRRLHVLKNRLLALTVEPMKAAWPDEVPGAWDMAVIVTKPFVVTGTALEFDASINALGGLSAEFLDLEGNVIPGYDYNKNAMNIHDWVDVKEGKLVLPDRSKRRDMSKGVIGDDTNIRIGWRWKQQGIPEGEARVRIWPDWDISDLRGQAVRLRILAHGADIFAFSTPERPPQDGELLTPEVIANPPQQ